MNLSLFKSVMLNYYLRTLQIIYDPKDPRTFKTICLKCNFSHSLAFLLSC